MNLLARKIWITLVVMGPSKTSMKLDKQGVKNFHGTIVVNVDTLSFKLDRTTASWIELMSLALVSLS